MELEFLLVTYLTHCIRVQVSWAPGAGGWCTHDGAGASGCQQHAGRLLHNELPQVAVWGAGVGGVVGKGGRSRGVSTASEVPWTWEWVHFRLHLERYVSQCTSVVLLCDAALLCLRVCSLNARHQAYQEATQMAACLQGHKTTRHT